MAEQKAINLVRDGFPTTEDLDAPLVAFIAKVVRVKCERVGRVGKKLDGLDEGDCVLINVDLGAFDNPDMVKVVKLEGGAGNIKGENESAAGLLLKAFSIKRFSRQENYEQWLAYLAHWAIFFNGSGSYLFLLTLSTLPNAIQAR